MRRVAAFLGLVGVIAIIEKVLVDCGLIELSLFLRFVAAGILIFLVCRFFGIWPFSAG